MSMMNEINNLLSGLGGVGGKRGSINSLKSGANRWQSRPSGQAHPDDRSPNANVPTMPDEDGNGHAGNLPQFPMRNSQGQRGTEMSSKMDAMKAFAAIPPASSMRSTQGGGTVGPPHRMSQASQQTLLLKSMRLDCDDQILAGGGIGAHQLANAQRAPASNLGLPCHLG